MRSLVCLLGLALSVFSQSTYAAGILIPTDKSLPPLAMVNHKVTATIDDQVAITTIEQSFRNHTDRNLEATYIFPVPRGASVNKFTMWIDGKETAGELLDAKKASQIYTDIVRRTQDPGILEYLGNDMMRLKVFPIPPKKDQKVRISFTSVAQAEQGVVEYLYPLKTDGKSTNTLEEFSVRVEIKSQHPIQTVYSPTHAIDVKHKGEKEVTVDFEKTQALLDKDFQLFYGIGEKEIGLTPISYRPVSAEDGYFTLLISPQLESSKARNPRDLVLVLDTSGSMSDLKMSQAKKALKRLLAGLHEDDRFGLISFASSVKSYEDKLLPATTDQMEKARKWVDDLRAGGGTAIQPALDAALDMRGKEAGRSFTVAFFTDGVPTIDERNPDKIVAHVTGRAEKSENVRIFTFGVGDDVNATMLDRLADSTRAVSTYVRPAEDIEAKAAALNAKISNPAMTNVKLTTTNVKLLEMFPPKIPDLFQGGQLTVIGRYSGSGSAKVKLTGMVGGEERELTYEVNFPAKTEDGRDFVEHLWARRKVGFLLDQIRANGESKEVVDEVTALAKKYGIATPYTSWLVVPDTFEPVIPPVHHHRFHGALPLPGAVDPSGAVPGLMPEGDQTNAKPQSVEEFAKSKAGGSGGIGGFRGDVQDKVEKQMEKEANKSPEAKKDLAEGIARLKTEQKLLRDVQQNYAQGKMRDNQQGQVGVDLALTCNNLRAQSRVTLTANRQAQGRNCVEVGGVWVDEQFNGKTPTLAIKAQSEAYFKILEKQPKMKDVYRLGNHVVWIAPNGTALVIDLNNGKETLTDDEIDALFAAKK